MDNSHTYDCGDCGPSPGNLARYRCKTQQQYSGGERPEPLLYIQNIYP